MPNAFRKGHKVLPAPLRRIDFHTAGVTQALHLLFCCPAAECLQCSSPSGRAGGLGIPEPLGQFQKAHGRRPVRFQMVYGGMQIIRSSELAVFRQDTDDSGPGLLCEGAYQGILSRSVAAVLDQPAQQGSAPE